MIQKYLAALLSIALVVVTAFVAIPADQITPTSVGQLAVLALGAVVTFLVPLLQGPWAAGLKTGSAVLAAIILAALPFFTQGYITPTQIAIVVLAALNALAVQVGVDIRTDASKARHAAVSNITINRPA